VGDITFPLLADLDKSIASEYEVLFEGGITLRVEKL